MQPTCMMFPTKQLYAPPQNVPSLTLVISTKRMPLFLFAKKTLWLLLGRLFCSFHFYGRLKLFWPHPSHGHGENCLLIEKMGLTIISTFKIRSWLSEWSNCLLDSKPFYFVIYIDIVTLKYLSWQKKISGFQNKEIEYITFVKRNIAS